MVGGAALRYCLENPDVSSVTIIGRRSVGIFNEKLREIIHDDFENYGVIADAFEGIDAALFCLGAYTGSVPGDEFRRITVDIPVTFGKVLREASPDAAFCLLSGAGADQTEKSRMSFARYKGAAENALLAMGFPRTHIFRPGYIYPVTPRKEPNFSYKLSRAIYPVLNALFPSFSIPSDDLARAMVMAGLEGIGDHENPILENKDIRRIAGL